MGDRADVVGESWLLIVNLYRAHFKEPFSSCFPGKAVSLLLSQWSRGVVHRIRYLLQKLILVVIHQAVGVLLEEFIGGVIGTNYKLPHGKGLRSSGSYHVGSTGVNEHLVAVYRRVDVVLHAVKLQVELLLGSLLFNRVEVIAHSVHIQGQRLTVGLLVEGEDVHQLTIPLRP